MARCPVLGLLLLATGLAAPGRAFDATRLEPAALALVNRARADHGLHPLRPDARLTAAARAHATEMRDLVYTGHESPILLHRDPAARLGAAGVPDAAWGENVGHYGSTRTGTAWDEALVVLAARLLASPPHRRNLLDPAFTHVGLGLATGRAPADADPGTMIPALWMAQLFTVRRLSDLAASAVLGPGGWRVTFTGRAREPAVPRLVARRDGLRPLGATGRLRHGRFALGVTLPPASGRWRVELYPGPGGDPAAAYSMDTSALPADAVRALPDAAPGHPEGGGGPGGKPVP